MFGLSFGPPTADGLPFTAAAQQLLVDASAESDRFRHGYLGTEHLVLALTRQCGSDAALARLEIDSAHAGAILAEKVQLGEGSQKLGGKLPYTSRTKKAVTLAAACAREHGSVEVDVKHLIVGLLRERLNPGAQVLTVCGLTEQRVLADLRRR